MTDERKRWLEKWGMIGAIATIVSVALLVIIQLAIISRWTGAIEAQQKVECQRNDKQDEMLNKLPERYVTRVEHVDLQKSLDEIKADVKNGFKDLGTELRTHTSQTKR